MNYYQGKDGQIYYYNNLQIAQGLHEGKEPLTAKELEEHLRVDEQVEVSEEVSLQELKGELQGLVRRAGELVEMIERREELEDVRDGEGAELGDGPARGERDTGGVLDDTEEGSTGRGDAPR